MLTSNEIAEMSKEELTHYFDRDERSRRWDEEEAAYEARTVESLKAELAENKATEATLIESLEGKTAREIHDLPPEERHQKAASILERIGLMMTQQSLNHHIAIKEGTYPKHLQHLLA